MLKKFVFCLKCIRMATKDFQLSGPLSYALLSDLRLSSSVKDNSHFVWLVYCVYRKLG